MAFLFVCGYFSVGQRAGGSFLRSLASGVEGDAGTWSVVPEDSVPSCLPFKPTFEGSSSFLENSGSY